jgi:glycosyltransferase involved in cell wall biosynthesis
MNESRAIHLSIVAPAYNEAENLPQLVAESIEAGRAVGEPFEVVITNDASTDGTDEVLDHLRAEHTALRVVDLLANAGQSAALDAAIRAARGQYIATLDADCQNDPADIPQLLKLITAGELDLVNGWRADRQDAGWRLIVSKYGNGFRNWMTRETIHDSGCGLKVFRAECYARVRMFHGYHRFFATLVRMDGWRVGEARVNHRARTRGVAKYGFFDRFFKVLRDAVAVRWMQDKTVLYQTCERTAPPG